MFCRSTRITPHPGWEQFCPRWVQKEFSRGNQSSFPRCAKISFLDAFSGIRNATDWNSISCYVTTSNNTILLCMLSTNESRLILSCCHRCFLWFTFSEDKHWYSFMSPCVFIPKRLWFFRRFYWRNVFPRWPPFQLASIPRSTGERYHADVWGNRLLFPPKTKNNFSGIVISQPTPWLSLSVPSFSLEPV